MERLDGYTEGNGGHVYSLERVDMAILMERGDMAILMETGTCLY